MTCAAIPPAPPWPPWRLVYESADADAVAALVTIARRPTIAQVGPDGTWRLYEPDGARPAAIDAAAAPIPADWLTRPS